MNTSPQAKTSRPVIPKRIVAEPSPGQRLRKRIFGHYGFMIGAVFLAIIFAIAAGSIALGIVGALIAVPIAGAVYGVAKYLTGRDPDHPFPPVKAFDPQPDAS